MSVNEAENRVDVFLVLTPVDYLRWKAALGVHVNTDHIVRRHGESNGNVFAPRRKGHAVGIIERGEIAVEAFTLERVFIACEEKRLLNRFIIACIGALNILVSIELAAIVVTSKKIFLIILSYCN